MGVEGIWGAGGSEATMIILVYGRDMGQNHPSQCYRSLITYLCLLMLGFCEVIMTASGLQEIVLVPQIFLACFHVLY